MNSWGQVADEGFIEVQPGGQMSFSRILGDRNSIPTKSMTQRKGNKKIRQIKKKEKKRQNKQKLRI